MDVVATAAAVPVRSPLTGSENVAFVERLAAAELIALWQSQVGIDVADELRGHDWVNLYECRDTGLRFFWPAELTGSEVLYARLQEQPWYYEAEKWEHQIALASLSARHPKGRLLEVGCGTGDFVRRALADGLLASGIEINAEAVRAARAAGLPVTADDLGALAGREPGQTDAVCAFQVLEHVRDVREFIASCTTLLRPGGTLVFGVPNARGPLEYCRMALDMPPHHMTRWSAATFGALERLFPLRLLRAEAQPLGRNQTGMWAAGVCGRLRTRHPWTRGWLANRATQYFLQRIARAGARRWATGHTLYVELERR